VKAGWEVRALEECLQPFPIAAKIPKKQFLTQGQYPILSQEADFINGYWDEVGDLNHLTSPVVLFGDHTQVLKFIDFNFVVGADGVKILAPKSGIDAKFLMYFIEANPFPSLGYARHYRHVKSLPIPLPPLEEQKRIVAVLDAAFEGLTRARTHIETNLQNARELFESVLEQTVKQNIADYGLTSLAECASEITDGDHSPPPKAPKGIPFITISNIQKETRRIDFSSTFFVSKSYFDSLKDKRKPKNGDILYTVTGATLGIPIQIKEDRDFCFQRHIGLIRPTDQMESNWLSYFLMFRFAFDQATDGASGAAQKTVSLKTLRGMKLPKVPQSRQKEIATALEINWEEIGKLKAHYRTKLADLDDLRQSLLARAFAGALT